MSVLIDRLIGLFSLVFLGSISAFILYGKINNPKILVVVFIMISVSLFIIIFFTHQGFASTFRILRIPALSKRLITKIRNLYLLVYECKRHKRHVLIAFIFSIIFQFCTFLTNFILARSLNIPIELGTFCMLLPLVSLFGLIPSINGLGVREGAYIYFFHFFTSTENAFALSLMADIFIFSCSFVGLLCFLFHKEVTIKEIKTSKIELNNMEMSND